MRFMSVDLPDPDGPMTATYSFLWIWTLTPRRARTSSEPMSYSRVSLCVRMMTSGSGVSPVRNSWTVLTSGAGSSCRPIPGWAARARLQIADRLIRARDDRVALMHAFDDLEVLLAGDAHLYGMERRHTAVDEEHAFCFLLICALRAPTARVSRCRGLGRSTSRPLLGRDRRILAYGQRDDRNRQRLFARIRHDPRGGRQVGPHLGRRIHQRDFDFVVHGAVALRAADSRGGRQDRAVGDLGDAPDERRVRKRVDRDLDRIAQMQPHDVGIVDLHLGLNDREIRDREQQTGFARERSGHRDL